MFAFERNGGTNKNGYSLVVLNATKSTPATPASRAPRCRSSLRPGLVLEDALSGDTWTVAGDGTVDVSVEAMSTVILVPSGDVG